MESCLEDIIGIVYNNWTGLKMSIDHGMGGNSQSVAEKVTYMITEVKEKLSNDHFSWEEISDFIDNIMDVEFNTVLEDNSTDEVAKVICELFNLWRESKQNELTAILNQMPVKVPIQNGFKLSPPPSQHHLVERDTSGNTYIVESSAIDDWIEVKRRR